MNEFVNLRMTRSSRWSTR